MKEYIVLLVPREKEFSNIWSPGTELFLYHFFILLSHDSKSFSQDSKSFSQDSKSFPQESICHSHKKENCYHGLASHYHNIPAHSHEFETIYHKILGNDLLRDQAYLELINQCIKDE